MRTSKPPIGRRSEAKVKRTVKKPRDGTLFGRTRSMRKENVAVYCDQQGETRVDVWTAHERRGSVRMSLSAARVLRKALDDYLSAAVVLLALLLAAPSHAATTLGDVTEGSTFCVALTFRDDAKALVTPSSLQCRLITRVEPGTGTELWPLQSFTPSTSTHRVCVPANINVVVLTQPDKPRPPTQTDLLSCAWTWPGGTRRDEWAITVNNLAAQPFP